MMEFFKSIMGKRFFEGHVPRLLKHLSDIATELKSANDLKERQIGERQVRALDKWSGHNPDPQGYRPVAPKAPPKPPGAE